MRILYVIHQVLRQVQGETERVCLNLARTAQRAGHYVHVLACTMELDGLSGSVARTATQPQGCVRTIYQGVPVSCIHPLRPPLSAEFSLDDLDEQVASEVARWMASEGFGIAHLIHPMWTDSALLAVQRSGIPYLVTLTDFFSCFRGTLVDVAGKPRFGHDGSAPPWTERELTGRFDKEETFLGGAAARTCPSEFLAAQYRADFPNLSFSVIPHGVDVLALASSESDIARCDGEVRLGYVDTLVPQKGIDVLLRAFVGVPNSNLRLKICCGHSDDETFAQDMKQLAGSDWRIELLAPVSAAEVFGIIQSLDVLCIPSRVPAAFSLVLHEAAAAGVPALVSALGEPGELVAEYGSGMVLPEDDVAAWVAAISRLSERPSLIKGWAAHVPLPRRVEEEAFFYESLYRQSHLA